MLIETSKVDHNDPKTVHKPILRLQLHNRVTHFDIQEVFQMFRQLQAGWLAVRHLFVLTIILYAALC